ncbi:fibroblast growth factor receptor substrate 3-like protein [Leptotrombidium deliense]|uniref:Fibroblast growth factor receptor substrate 3-like protein n=1 Tax=Leptotrombidium deliense TaxID=299467 RepID=A0A443SCX4_9ACAR|nr:fibroblast growth factor receptor substrate 3-like protein [Leptotrombidium deliense]
MGCGNEINCGQIEVTDADLILHQRGKNSIFWSLSLVLLYLYSTLNGILMITADLYVVMASIRNCSALNAVAVVPQVQAEQLFVVLQESIQRCSNTTIPPSFLANLPNHITSPQHLSGLVSISSPSVATDTNGAQSGALMTTSAVRQQQNNPPHLYANNVHQYTNTPCYVNVVKCTSDGVTSPVSNGPPVRLSSNAEFTGTTDVNTNYAKLDDLVRYYVNINTPQSQKVLNTGRTSNSFDNNQSSRSLPNSPTPVDTQQSTCTTAVAEMDEPVNYVTLDLDTNSASCGSPTYVTTAPATPVSKTPKNGELTFNTSNGNCLQSSSACNGGSQTPRQYATIDFDKTVALSNSVVNHRQI